MERDIRQGLKREEFFLVYQPLVNTATQRVDGFEALIRWQHPERGLVRPDDFIPIAEESGLIKPLGRWIIESAIHQLAQWHTQGFSHLRLAINVSGKQFQSANFAAAVESTIHAAQIDAHKLELEITESVMMDDVKLAAVTLKLLKAIGVTVAIDDFGTGFSSMAYLKRFPIDRLKIDRSFVTQIVDSNEDQAIVNATLSLAKNLNLNVITEGVETQAQLDFLIEAGCHEFQGYLFSKPLMVEQARGYLNTDPFANGGQGNPTNSRTA